MRIENDIKLDFQDVLLKPKRSIIESRKDINLERVFKFRWADLPWMGIPIISSNMTSVTTPKIARKMTDHNMLACVPKTTTGDLFIHANLIPSIGLNDPYERYEYSWVAVDVPNGYIERVVDLTKKIRDMHQNRIRLIVGNVVTAEMTEALILAGADIVKVGIGSGAACSTRIKTGIGMPQLSAIIECADAAHGLGGHVISDGGCTSPGDIVKAFSGGADFVMLGGMLAGHDENAEICKRCNGTGDMSNHFMDPRPTAPLKCTDCNGTGRSYDFYGSSSERGNAELAGGLKDYRASEGWELKLQPRGPIDRTLQDIEGGLRSACAYVGARDLKALPKCATMVLVNRQANTSLWENRI